MNLSKREIRARNWRGRRRVRKNEIKQHVAVREKLMKSRVRRGRKSKRGEREGEREREVIHGVRIETERKKDYKNSEKLQRKFREFYK